MNSFIVKKWKDWYPGEMSEDAVRAMFRPESNYRITSKKFPVGTKIAGSTRAGTCFVLTGNCTFTYSEAVCVASGEFLEHPSGNFQLVVVGDEEVRLINVWLLPLEFRIEYGDD